MRLTRRKKNITSVHAVLKVIKFYIITYLFDVKLFNNDNVLTFGFYYSFITSSEAMKAATEMQSEFT